jgi:Mg2+ and Co2+ transporter CorA
LFGWCHICLYICTIKIASFIRGKKKLKMEQIHKIEDLLQSGNLQDVKKAILLIKDCKLSTEEIKELVPLLKDSILNLGQNFAKEVDLGIKDRECYKEEMLKIYEHVSELVNLDISPEKFQALMDFWKEQASVEAQKDDKRSNQSFTLKLIAILGMISLPIVVILTKNKEG